MAASGKGTLIGLRLFRWGRVISCLENLMSSRVIRLIIMTLGPELRDVLD
jgi:hypothetical protein